MRWHRVSLSFSVGASLLAMLSDLNNHRQQAGSYKGKKC
jgi:hypothetical protein